jgi:hypothetical protein
MAIQIVMDGTGDSRQPFRSERRTRAGEGGAALLRADEGRLHCRGPDRFGSGLANPIVRPERGGNRVLPQAGRRVNGSRHVALNTVSAGRTFTRCAEEVDSNVTAGRQ